MIKSISTVGMTKPDPIELLSKQDLILGRLIKSIGNYSIQIHDNLFESLLKSIVYQQLQAVLQMPYTPDFYSIMVILYQLLNRLFLLQTPS